jgi:predicted Zn-dependent protease
MKTMRPERYLLCAAVLLVVSISFATTAMAYTPPPTCENAFTEQSESEQGAQVAAQVFTQMPVLKDSDPIAVYVRKLGARLVQQAPGYAWQYNFHVVDSDQINAFALPGGSIFINLATVQAAETEAQLAGAMAHEISHVVLRHSTCNITKRQRRSIWYGLGQIAASATLGGSLGTLAAQGIGVTAGLDFLHMGRDAEKQADLLGTDILYDAGYDPRGMPQFFEVIQGKYGNGGSQFLSDHPNPGNRSEYVNAEIRTLPPREKNLRTSEDFTRVRALANSMKPITAEAVKAGEWKTSDKYQKSPTL